MSYILEEAVNQRSPRSCMISIPNSVKAKAISRDLDLEPCYCADVFQKGLFKDIWSKQHPLIHTWLLLSSISICFLSALFFIFP